jgi:aminopeptidase N
MLPRRAPLVLVVLATLTAHAAGTPAVATAAATTSPPTPTPPTLRLPAGARPVRYALDLTIVPATPTFSGRVTIDLQLGAATSLLWLNATDLTIAKATLLAGGETLPARVVPGGADFVGFVFPRAVGGPAQLVIDYSGKLDGERSRGLYRQSEGSGADDWYAYTFFESIDARRAFPCFDEPNYKVPWQLTFHVKAAHVAQGNSPVVSETAEPNGMKKVVLAPSKPLPSYLVAFVVGPFELVDGGKAGRKPTQIRFIVPRGRGGETGYAREVTPRLVKLLEDYFDMPYPYEKLDVAVVPRFWGTMEHPGIVALGQPLTLIKPGEESLRRKQQYANTAVHELGHYWFGDYVTCAWWDDIWLNESFGEWIDTKLTNQLEPSWKWALTNEPQHAISAMSTDALASTPKLRRPVETRDAIEGAFEGEITYSKGATLLRMIERWVGEEKFRGIIQRYLKAHAWGNATEADFVSALASGAGADVAAAFSSFVDQPGVPLVGARAICDAGKPPRLELTQARFFAKATSLPPSQASTRWQIPVCVKLGDAAGETQKCTMLSDARAEVPLDRCPAWLMPNANAAGYFRSRYDGAALRALAPAYAKLDLSERVRVTSDVEAQAEAGTLPAADALTLLPTVLAESDLRPFFAGLQMMLRLVVPDEQPAAQQQAFRRLVAKLIVPRAHAAGWTPQPDEDPLMSLARPGFWRLTARWGNDKEAPVEARRLADAWLTDRKAVAPDMVETVLSLAAESGDAAFFDRLLAEARRVTDRRERGQILGALGVFAAPKLRDRAFALTLSSEFDLREALGGLQGAFWHHQSRDAAWSFLKSHWDAIVPRMRADETIWLVSAVPQAFCDPAHRKDVADFLGKKATQSPGASHALAESLERVDVCVATVKRGHAAVVDFLKRY